MLQKFYCRSNVLHPSDTCVGDANKRCHVLCSLSEQLALQFITTSHRTGLCQASSALCFPLLLNAGIISSGT